jgi:hypothetical protein
LVPVFGNALQFGKEPARDPNQIADELIHGIEAMGATLEDNSQRLRATKILL